MTTPSQTSPLRHALWQVEAPLASAVAQAAQQLWQCPAPVAAESTIEIPDDPAHGDLSCTMALKLARALKRPPLELAQQLAEALPALLRQSEAGSAVARVEVKPPGFLNCFLQDAALHALLTDIARDGNRFGRSPLGAGRRISLEFVSANPTGPLSVAHGRQAAVGDALARVLTHAGFEVCREYLINDEGTQMDLLGQSLYARYLQHSGRAAEIPEGGYHGSYLADSASRLMQRDGAQWLDRGPIEALPHFRSLAIQEQLAGIQDDLRLFDVGFDEWTSQARLRERGLIDRAIDDLRRAGHVYDAEGALWFRATAFGDEKDRVLRKQDGTWTYVAPDIAYHREKFARGFDRVVDLWGPDHHGYVPRLKAAVQALTGQGEQLTVLIVQLVTLYRRGVAVPMSTRQGQFVTLRELIDEVGKDAARFFYLTRRIESHLDFDLELAKEQSLENPVYYVQYAHARICSILKFQAEQGGPVTTRRYEAGRLRQPEELRLLRTLRQFPLVIELCARQLDPYTLTWYLRRLAGDFHACYAKHRVVSEDQALSAARLALAAGVGQVLAIGLGLLGVAAPQAMTRSDDSRE